MKRLAILTALAVAWPGSALADSFKATLTSYQEVPSVSSLAEGTFEAKSAGDWLSVDYTLTFSGLQAAVQQAHIHFAQPSVNGPIIIWICGTSGTPGPAGMVPRVKRFVVAGLFDSGLYDYDTTLAYMAVPDAQRFFDLHDGITGIEVRVRDIYAARGVARAIEAALGGFPYRARDWMEVNRNLFSALKLEKVVYGIVLCLIVVVAAFNILASLTMVVKEKRRDIAILKSMGGSNRSIGRIFILNGAVIGVAGTLLGNLLGLGGCWLLAHYRFVELPKDVFLVTTLPVRMDPINFLVVATVSVGICVVAALSPARRAASLVPVEVIRYE